MNNFVCVRNKVARVSRFCASAVVGLIPMTAQAQDSVRVDTEKPHKMVITAEGVLPEAPVFFTAKVVNSMLVQPSSVEHSIVLVLDVLQGSPKTLSLELIGPTDEITVHGEQVKNWAIRKDLATGKTYLDLSPVDEKVKSLTVVLKRHVLRESTKIKALTIGPNTASGFSHALHISWKTGEHLKLTKAIGCQPVQLPANKKLLKSLVATGASEVEIELIPDGSSLADVELRNLKVSADVAADGKSAKVSLSGSAFVRDDEGGKLELVSGKMALSKFPHGAGYVFNLNRNAKDPNITSYELVFDKKGSYPINLDFVVSLQKTEGWNGLNFKIPHGAVVPVSLSGVPSGSRFLIGGSEIDSDPQVKTWNSFLPASGQCALRWKPQRKDADGELFFTTQSLVDVQVGAGMLRENTRIDVKVLQGKLRKLNLQLEGLGDVVSLTGAHVGSWAIKENGDKRWLEIVFNGERTEVGSLSIQTQHPIGNFPAKVKPLRITPEGAMRHAGYVRLSNNGAVKLGVSSLQGMMQLSPNQFPGVAFKKTPRQIFVYRFPSAERDWAITADQILPEVSVNEVLVYKLSETDRELHAAVELDIREAPLREWEMRIPADYAVAGVQSAELGNMVVGRTVTDSQRTLKITFKKEVIGGQLIKVQLARNAATAAGVWELQKISYPQAKSVRGNMGVEAALGWRVVPKAVEKLVEMPLAYFPNKSQALQQAFRLRDANWKATMEIEALEQSVQADVFHLYSLKEGMLYGSVLVNYFVIGAPMHEWQVLVPGLDINGGMGNMMVEGQNVRSWRQEGDKLIVTLHQPTLGGSTLLVSFEKPMSARGGTIELGKIQPLDAQTESGFIQVVSPTQVKQSATVEKGLLKLGATELSAEYRLMSSAPSLDSWQYAARGFELQIQVEWYAPSQTVGQVVDFATLETQVSRDGEVVTEAKFFVKTRGRKALEMALPEGSTLWEVRAAGETLNARKDGEKFLLPLPASIDPNTPVEVFVRYGGAADNASKPVVGVPVLAAPIVISEWKVSSDRGYLLEVVGGNVKPVAPNLTETGFEWINKRFIMLVGTLLFVVGGAWGCRAAPTGGWKPLIGALWLVLALVISLSTAEEASSDRRVNHQSFEVVAPVVAAEKQITLELSNLPKAKAMRSTTWTAVAGLGVLGIIASFLVAPLKNRLTLAAGLALVGLGLLGQHGGAVPFYLALALVIGILLAQLVWKWFGGARIRNAAKAAKKAAEDAASRAAITAMLVFSLLTGFSTNADAGQIADSIEQRWEINGERLSAEMDVKWNAKAGESILLVQAPASLTKLEADGARVNKLHKDGRMNWFLVAEKSGIITAKVRYQMPMAGLGDKHWTNPTGASAMHQMTVKIDQEAWEVNSNNAVRLQALSNLAEGQSGAQLVFAPVGNIQLKFQPKRRDPESEPTRFFVESADLYVPSPGVVDAWHRLLVRPVSGRVTDLMIDVPAGMMVGEVLGNGVEDWRYDPKTQMLKVHLAQPQSKQFQVLVQTQRGLNALPQSLSMAPLRVREASSVVGVFGIAFGKEAQPDALKPVGLATANLSDFDKSMFQMMQKTHRDLVLQKVYRYGKDKAQLDLQVDPVAAELRVVTKQVLSIAEERMVLSVDATIDIVRAGIFELRCVIPKNLEVESISGAALREWTEIEEGGKRFALLQLNGRTLGTQKFNFSFAGTSPVVANKSLGSWEVPHVEISQAVRQTGELIVVPEQGIRARVVKRQHVSQQDARHSGRHRKGDLAFKLLQGDWQLSLGIEKLDPWVRAQLLQEVSLREGQTRTRLSLSYEVENAAVKALQIRLPGLNEEEARTVRASGAVVNEIVHLKEDLWELRLRRGMIGKVVFEVEYQRSVEARNAQEAVVPAVLENVRQVKHFVSVRSSGRLDIRAENVVGWRAADWNGVPKALKKTADNSVPALCYSVSEPEDSLAVKVKRHEVANALRLRVLKSKLTTLFATDSSALTLVEMQVRVVEKHTMRALLPEGAELFSVTVNGESVEVVKQGDEQLFYVTAGADDNSLAEVKLMYRAVGNEKVSKKINLEGPSFSAPLENVDWFVSLPEGYELVGRSKAFDFVGAETKGDVYGVQEYQSSMSLKKKQQATLARNQLDQANSWISTGDYKKAEKVLSQVSKNRAVDAASNEDARVQLRNIRNQQAMMGLNTRRQKIYLDNKADGNGVYNAAFEEAANSNPLFQGKEKYAPAQVEQLLMGNTAEERDAMQRIADRMVSQQLAAQPAPQVINVTMPETGALLHFRRGSQLNANTPLELELEIEQPASYGLAAVLKILALLGFTSLVVLVLKTR